MQKVTPYEIRLDDNIEIWRYIDISKFLDMLINSTLFFTRIDILEDNYEGTTPFHQKEFLKTLLNVPMEHSDRFEIFKREGDTYFRKHTAVNCWHLNDSESIAMWKIYLKTGEGIAIKSNYGRFVNSFVENHDTEIYIRPVTYGDYNQLEFGNFLYGEYFHKRQFFSYENELRAMVIKTPSAEEFEKLGGDYSLHKGLNGGVPIKVDLNILIEKIVLAPNTPEWIFNTIKSITQNYNYTFPIERSQMDN